MRGKTHSQIGGLTYIILVVLPIGTYCSIFNLIGLGTNELDLFAVVFAYFGGLFPDADIEKSKINYHPLKAFEKITQVLIKCTYWIAVILLILCVKKYGGIEIGIGISILVISYTIINKFSKKESKIKNPIFKLYYLLLGISFMVFGLYMTGYSLQLIKIITGGIFLIMIPHFPHRTLTHTPEGMFMTYMGVSYIANLNARPQYGIAFMVGYFSHLYLTDLLTKRGVYISIIPHVLRKLRSILPKKTWRKIITSKWYKNINRSVSLHLMSVGTKQGDFFENLFTTVFYLLTIICILKFGINLENEFISIQIPKF